MRHRTRLLAVTTAAAAVVSLGLAVTPAQAASPKAEVRLVKTDSKPDKATKDRAKAKFKSTTTINPTSTTSTSSTSSTAKRPPSDPPPPTEPPPSTLIVPTWGYSATVTEVYPTADEVFGNNGQTCVDGQLGLWWEHMPVNHLADCQMTRMIAQVIDPATGAEAAHAFIDTYTLHQSMVPDNSARRTIAKTVVDVGPVEGLDLFEEIDATPVTIGFNCLLGTGARSCYTGNNFITMTLGQWRTFGGQVLFTFDAGDGDGWTDPLGDNFSNYDANLIINQPMPASIHFRCDYAKPFRNMAPGMATGCVFPSGTSTFSRLRGEDPNVDDAADHVYDALVSPWTTYPPAKGTKVKVIPADLTRTTSDTVQANNRKAATCDPKDPNINNTADYQCDEYPFASTNQGAASGGYYSTRLIPAGDNERAGQYLGAFYTAWRIANGDPFHVTATAKP